MVPGLPFGRYLHELLEPRFSLRLGAGFHPHVLIELVVEVRSSCAESLPLGLKGRLSQLSRVSPPHLDPFIKLAREP